MKLAKTWSKMAFFNPQKKQHSDLKWAKNGIYGQKSGQAIQF